MGLCSYLSVYDALSLIYTLYIKAILLLFFQNNNIDKNDKDKDSDPCLELNTPAKERADSPVEGIAFLFYNKFALDISKFKRLSEMLRDIRTSTYQICSIEEKINPATTFHK